MPFDKCIVLDKDMDVFTAGIGLDSDINTNACPACEYKHGTKGKPVYSQGAFICLSCGNEWKEVIQLERSSSTRSGLVEAKPAKWTTSDQPYYSTENLERHKAKHTKSQSGLVGVSLAVLLLFAGVIASYLYLTGGQVSPVEKGVHVSELNFEEIIRQNRGKVVQVKGTILNTDNRSKQIKRLALILRKSNGSELTRWYYTSPVMKLSPGAKTQFVSSIQYDTPIIASVDAVFD